MANGQLIENVLEIFGKQNLEEKKKESAELFANMDCETQGIYIRNLETREIVVNRGNTGFEDDLIKGGGLT